MSSMYSVRAELQKQPLRDAIRATDAIVEAVKLRLAAAEEITSLGLEVLGPSILAIKPPAGDGKGIRGWGPGAIVP